MEELLSKFKELSIKYNNLCFKVLEGDFFVVGIVSNDGPIIYKFDIKYYNDFNVQELDNLKYFSSLEQATLKRLSETDFANTNYFMTNENKLYKYYGNSSIVNIPDYIDTICHGSFKDNKYIEVVNGKNVKEVQYYSFRNNINLKSINFPKLEWIGNILNAPNLKHYTISNNLTGFINEDNDYTNSTITINETTYVFDDSIESDFLNDVDAIKESPEEQVQLVKIKDNERKFRTVHDDNRNETIVAISEINKRFNELPDVIKDIFYNTNHILYVVNGIADAGQYFVDKNIILVERTQVNYAFYHEIGHMVDKYLDNISQTYDFKRIYYMESYKLYKDRKKSLFFMSKPSYDHLIEDSCEYFAESFKRYLDNDPSFITECPNTYMFIKDTVEFLNKQKNMKLSLHL